MNSLRFRIPAISKEWSLRPAGTFLLLALLLMIALIQILPQVDLPDTDFHGDTAPVVIKSRATSAPVLVSAALATETIASFPLVREHALDEQTARIPLADNFVPILYCSLLC